MLQLEACMQKNAQACSMFYFEGSCNLSAQNGFAVKHSVISPMLASRLWQRENAMKTIMINTYQYLVRWQCHNVVFGTWWVSRVPSDPPKV
jgi:hypothetical protein